MLYRLAHIIQEKFPWLWEVVEDLNAVVCGLKIGNIDCLQECLMKDVRIASINDAGGLADVQQTGDVDLFFVVDAHQAHEIVGKEIAVVGDGTGHKGHPFH